MCLVYLKNLGFLARRPFGFSSRKLFINNWVISGLFLKEKEAGKTSFVTLVEEEIEVYGVRKEEPFCRSTGDV